jgi:hypothetical protein
LTLSGLSRSGVRLERQEGRLDAADLLADLLRSLLVAGEARDREFHSYAIRLGTLDHAGRG